MLRAAQLTVGNFIRATREAQRLTQQQVAKRTIGTHWQISRAAISAIERGQNFPGLEAMLALSNVLRIDPKEVVERARLTAVVPVDVTGLTDEELQSRASQFFWGGDFRRALSVYDAMMEKLALEEPDAPEEVAIRVAKVEIQRATTLKRAGALLSAIAAAERAISLSVNQPAVQADAYVAMADLQVQRGHLPLARDASQRALELSAGGSPKTRCYAWMAHGRCLYLSGQFEEAEHAFRESLRQAELAGEVQHLTHAEGNIGICYLARGDLPQAIAWVGRAAERARRQQQPVLEASWLLELGKIALSQGHADEADARAQRALELSRPLGHALGVFRAQWLRHRVRVQRGVTETAAELSELIEMAQPLDQHDGIEEIDEFKKTVLLTAGNRTGS
ncbi:MAG TPA: tetratricopeptide repeat protein [Candidatus Polarisedimenticolaceae bacterium]|nr:tetratricopeptide repeat protein [Candidatus Polarisedimenticolaceae bacterium]